MKKVDFTMMMTVINVNKYITTPPKYAAAWDVISTIEGYETKSVGFIV